LPVISITKKSQLRDSTSFPASSSRTGSTRRPAKANVFVVEAGKVRSVPVEVGIADDAWIAVTTGLAAGARIAIGPARELRFLRDGDAVEQAPAPEAAAGGAADSTPAAAPNP
jgi:hypothetical protein